MKPVIVCRFLFFSIIISVLFIGQAQATFDNISANTIKINSTVVVWDSTTFGSSQIEYGTTESYGSLSSEDSFAYFHEHNLTGLTGQTLYHYRVRSKNYNGTETLSDDYTFTTRNQTELDNVIKAARVDGELPKIYYVSNSTGDNENNGTTIGSPWKTLANASTRLDAGDALEILDDVYTNDPMIAFDRSGIDVAPITIRNYQDGIVEMAGTCPNIDDSCTISGIDMNGMNYYTFDGLNIYNYLFGVAVGSANHIKIDNVEIYETQKAGVHLGSDGAVWNTLINSSIHNISNSVQASNGIQMSGQTNECQACSESYYLTIKNTSLYDVQYHGGIDLYGRLLLITLDGNNISDINGNMLASTHTEAFDNIRQIAIKNNNFHDCCGTDSILLYATHNSLFYNNTMENLNPAGIAYRAYSYSDTIWHINNTFNNSGDIYLQNTGGFGVGGFYFMNHYNLDGSTLVRSNNSATFINYSTTITLGSASNQATLEFYDGTVFKLPSVTGDYTATSITYTSNRSYMTISEVSTSNVVITFPVKYNMTVMPSQNNITLTNSSNLLNLTYSGAIPTVNITFGSDISKKINLDGLTGTTYLLEYANNGTDIENLTATGGVVNYTTLLDAGVYSISEDSGGSIGQVTGLENGTISPTTINISWIAVTGAAWYEIFLDFVHYDYVQDTFYNFTGLVASTLYSFQVRANDSLNNWGANSSILNVTTSASESGTGTSTGYLQVINSTTLRASNLTEGTGDTSTDYIKLLEITSLPENVSGTWNVSVQIKSSGADVKRFKKQKNGIDIGIEQDTSGFTYVWFNQTISGLQNSTDNITVWGKGTDVSSQTPSAKNLTISYDYVSASVIGGTGYNWSANGTFDNATWDRGTNKLLYGLYMDSFNDNNADWFFLNVSGTHIWNVTGGKLVQSDTGNNISHIYPNEVNLSEVNVLMKFNSTAGNGGSPGVIRNIFLLGRFTNQSSATGYNFYSGYATNLSANKIIHEVYNGAFSALNTTSTGVTLLSHTDYFINLLLNGTYQATRTWDSTTAMPDWQASSTNNTLLSGTVGLRTQWGNIYIDDFWVRNVIVTGNYTSNTVIDAGQSNVTSNFLYYGERDNGTVEVLMNTSYDNITWSGWTSQATNPQNDSLNSISNASRYIQIRVKIMGNETYSPKFEKISFLTSNDFTISFISPTKVDVSENWNVNTTRVNISSEVPLSNAYLNWQPTKGSEARWDNISMNQTSPTNWEYTFTNMNDGVYNYSVHAIASDGREVTTSIYYVEIDYDVEMTVQAVYLYQDTNGQYISNTTTTSWGTTTFYESEWKGWSATSHPSTMIVRCYNSSTGIYYDNNSACGVGETSMNLSFTLDSWHPYFSMVKRYKNASNYYVTLVDRVTLPDGYSFDRNLGYAMPMMPHAEDIKYINNSKIKFGVDCKYGGAGVYLAEMSNLSKNVINNYDSGRQLQNAYYDTGNSSEVYVQPGNWGDPWGYNPTLAGNEYSQPSNVSSCIVTSNSITVVVDLVAQWNPSYNHGRYSDLKLINTYILDGENPVITANYTYEHVGNVTHLNWGQETPTFYGIKELNVFKYRNSSGIQTPTIGSQNSSYIGDPNFPITGSNELAQYVSAINSSGWGVGLWNYKRPEIGMFNFSLDSIDGTPYSAASNKINTIPWFPINKTGESGNVGYNIAKIYLGNFTEMDTYFVDQDSILYWNDSNPTNINTSATSFTIGAYSYNSIVNATLNWTNSTGAFLLPMILSGGSNLSASYSFTGLLEYNYTYSVSGNFSNGNNDTTPIVWTYVELTPPASITNLQNVTTATTSNWTWTDPADADFDHVEVWLNGSFDSNISAGNQSFNATGLTPITEYIFSTRTVDTVGNINQTWVNQTTRTNAIASVVNGTIIATRQQPAKLYQRI